MKSTQPSAQGLTVRRIARVPDSDLYVPLAATLPQRENHARGGRFSHGSPCYLRCPASCNFSLRWSCLKFVFISVTNLDRPTSSHRWDGRHSSHFSDHIPAHRSAGRHSAHAGPVPTPRYLPWTTLPRPGPASSTVHAHTDVHALTSHGTVGTHIGQSARGRRANAPTRCLRVPCGPLCGRASGQRAYAAACRSSPPPRAARARSSSCSRPSRCMAATGPAATASIVGLVASSPARTAAASPPRLSAATT